MKDFNELFQQAAAIKKSQMHSQRKTFEKLPIFIKTGLYYSQKYQDCKSQPYEDRMKIAEELKGKGNAFFNEGKYAEAAHEYEQSLSIFKYIENRNPNWKNQGILDEDLTFIDVEGESEEEKVAIKDLKLKLYMNMAACYLKQKQLKESISACDYAINIEPCAKAYFRRARARLDDINADEKEYEQAINDLQVAQQLDPSDQGISYELRIRKSELSQIRKENRALYSSMVKNRYDQQNQAMNQQIIDKIVEKVDQLDNQQTVKETWQEQLKTHGITVFAIGILIFIGYVRFFGSQT